MNKGWQKIQKNLAKQLKPGIFQVWIKPLQGEVQENTLFLTAPNEFVASWVKERLLTSISCAAADVFGFEPEISIQGSNGKGESNSLPLIDFTSQNELRLPVDYVQSRSKSNWRYSFDDFVVGPCNQLAYTACTNVCSKDFPAHNVLVCSGPGLGKTHLLHSIGNRIHNFQEKEQPNVAYVSSEQFANQMVQALKAKEIDTFKKRYRENIDLLLLEDVHFFQGKDKMQEELLSLIKDLLDNGSKVVFSSSFLPKELSKVDSQLTSYFCSGLLAPIQEPDYDLRLRLIKRKAKKFEIDLPAHVRELIASHITSDIRQLESCIQNLALKTRLLKENITESMAKDILQNYSGAPKKQDLKNIIQFVCNSFNLSQEKVRSKSRKRQVVWARNTIFYLARKYTNLSLKDIGQPFNRLHSTVLKGITNVEMELSKNSSMGGQLLRIIEKIDE